jgi:hypothetical protein
VTVDPRALVGKLETTAALPSGSEERFSGYGVMGLPHRSGHVLAMRRFPASSVGPGYTSVWHRTPDSRWAFYADVAPKLACTRFFGADVDEAHETEIALAWPEPFRLQVSMPAGGFEWDVTVAGTAATRFMNTVGGWLPDASWRRPSVLAAMGAVAGPLLGAGRVGLQGHAPNGQRFIANPRLLWIIVDSRARLGAVDFGPAGPVHPQARLGDFWIPQRGILAIGGAYFDAFDPARHSAQTCRVP